MPEIKVPLSKLAEGVPYVPEAECYVITEENSLADILRFCYDQVGFADVMCLVLEKLRTLIEVVADDEAKD